MPLGMGEGWHHPYPRAFPTLPSFPRKLVLQSQSSLHQGGGGGGGDSHVEKSGLLE